MLTVSVTSTNLFVAGRVAEEKVFTEEDWSSEEGSVPYEKSKLRAEKAAWELVKNLPGNYKIKCTHTAVSINVFNKIPSQGVCHSSY